MGARTTTRESRLFVRCGRREKALIEAAAAALGMTVSEYVLSTVMDRSMAEVQRRNRLALSGEAFDQLAELMENDAEPAAGLVENARRYRDAMARRSLTVAD